MGFLTGKRALIVGVASKLSIASGIAAAMHREGAELAFTYQNDKLRGRVEEFAIGWGSRPELCFPCDVADDSQIEAVFAALGKHWDGLDIIVHSVGFAPGDQLDGDFTAVWWAFDGLPSGASLQVNGVRMAPVSDDGTVAGEWTTLEAVSFMPGWRDEGGPGTDAYSLDKPKDTVYVFFDVSDERMMVELDYTIVNGVPVVQRGELVTADEAELTAQANGTVRRYLGRL